MDISQLGVTSAVVDDFFGAAPRRLGAMAIQRRIQRYDYGLPSAIACGKGHVGISIKE